MQDRLKELLDKHDHLFGVICRDATMVELELMALAGYHVVWLDLEHGPQSNAEAVRLARTITHLGMVPLVRIPELSRTHVQVLLDGGIQILTLPDVRTAQQAAAFVQLGKYPPVGRRGVSSSSANFDYHLRDPVQDFRASNEATRLMVMIESDQGYEELDAMLEKQDQPGLKRFQDLLDKRRRDLESGLIPLFRLLENVKELEVVLEQLQMKLNAEHYLQRLLDRIQVEETT